MRRRWRYRDRASRRPRRQTAAHVSLRGSAQHPSAIHVPQTAADVNPRPSARRRPALRTSSPASKSLCSVRRLAGANSRRYASHFVARLGVGFAFPATAQPAVIFNCARGSCRGRNPVGAIEYNAVLCRPGLRAVSQPVLNTAPRTGRATALRHRSRQPPNSAASRTARGCLPQAPAPPQCSPPPIPEGAALGKGLLAPLDWKDIAGWPTRHRRPVQVFRSSFFCAAMRVLPSLRSTARCVSSPRHRSRQRTGNLRCHARMRCEEILEAAGAVHPAVFAAGESDGQNTHSRAEQKKKDHENIITKSSRAREQIRTFAQHRPKPKHRSSGTARPQRRSPAD